MTATASVSIDRSSLSLAALTIAGTSGSTYFLAGEGLGSPSISRRNTYMPDNPFIHGSELIGSVKEQSSLPLTVQVQASDAAGLDTALSDLYDALDQFSYSVTVTVDGVAKTWSCDPASYGSIDGNVSVIRQSLYFELVTITIPVYPIPS